MNDQIIIVTNLTCVLFHIHKGKYKSSSFLAIQCALAIELGSYINGTGWPWLTRDQPIKAVLCWSSNQSRQAPADGLQSLECTAVGVEHHLKAVHEAT